MVRSRQFRVTLLGILAIGLTLGMANLRAAEGLAAVQKQFIGDYELISFVRFPAGGGQQEADYIGRLHYDEFGYMMGLGMPRDLPLQAEGATEQVRGGFAYWGRVSFDLEDNRVIHHVEGSPGAAQWVGRDNIRYFEFDGDLLKLSLKDSSGRITATLTWRKYQ